MTTGTKLQLGSHNFFVAAIFVCFSLVHFSLFGSENDLFPVPENLKVNVEFWKNVYTLYDQDQIIIHDSRNLNIVYEIFDANEFFGKSEVSKHRIWQEIENIKNKYKASLQRLANLKKIQPDLLEAQDRLIFNLFIPDTSAKNFQRACQNIRAQQGLRGHFRKGIIRSQHYLPQIKQIFQRHEVPLELLALPHVESSFHHRAYSKFGAAGIWQFTRKTGRRFLKIDYTIDERFDPIKSTEAAAKLLKENYEELGSWPLAITAYNHGVNGMKRAVSQLKTDDLGEIAEKYESRSFKFASRNFYAEFIAAKEIEENYRIYFGEMPFEAPAKHLIFEVPNYVKIVTLTKQLGVSIEEIEELNPSLRQSVVTSQRRLPKGFILKIPFRENFDPATAYAQIPGSEKFQNQSSSAWYQVRYGDYLDKIAQEFKMSTAELIAINEISDPHQIYEGQVLKVKSGDTTDDTLVNAAQFAQVINRNESLKIEETGPFDVRTFGPQVYEKLIESSPENKATAKIIVQPNETLGHFADWLQLPTQELRKLNKLNFEEEIQVAQEIEVVYSNVTAEVFNRRRLEYHHSIEEDFFATFKVTKINPYKVQKGDNIWTLCNDVFAVPYWLVLRYNPDKDLQNLKPEEIILFPIVENISENASE